MQQTRHRVCAYISASGRGSLVLRAVARQRDDSR